MQSCLGVAMRAGIVLLTLVVAVPADAGRVRSTTGAHPGHPVSHRGVASFYRHSRGLPNGVAIFNGSSRTAHSGQVPINKARRPRHADKGKHRGRRHEKSGRNSRRATHAGNDLNHRGAKKKPKQAHKQRKRRGKRSVAYGSSVYVAAPPEEHLYPENGDGEDCRHLTERGYDRSGRRVLVEWTLCFDENGEAYVPADGRRILARY